MNVIDFIGKSIVNNTYYWECLIDQDGNYLHVSPACEKICGYKPDQFVNNPTFIIEITHPYYKEKVKKHFCYNKDEILSNYLLEFKIIREDGVECWIEHNCKSVFDNNGNYLGRHEHYKDVTEYKKRLYELEKREKKYRDIVELTINAISCTNQEGYFTFFNMQFSNLFGYSFDETKELRFLDLVHPDDKQRIQEKHEKRFINKESVSNYDFKGIKKDGTIVYIGIAVSYIVNLYGENDGSISYLRDITEQKIANEKIKIFAQTIESISEGVCIVNTDHKIFYINKAMQNMYGYSTEEIIGNTPKILSPNTPKVVSDTIYNEALNGGWKGVVWNVKKDGYVFPVDLTTSLVKNAKNETAAIVGIARDVTERMQSEKFKKIKFNISQALANNIKLDVYISFIIDQLKGIVNISNYYFALYDKENDSFSTSCILDEKDKFLSWSANKTLSALVVKNKKSLLVNREEIDRMVQNSEIDIVGTECESWLGVPVSVLGKTSALFVIQSYKSKNSYKIKDLEILEFVSDQLGKLIERKKYIKDLKKALKNAQESDQLKTAFLANMSHEIRTPLNGFLGFVKLLTSVGNDEEKRNHYIDIINKCSTQLLSIIGDIMNISKIETGQIEVNIEKFEINDLLKSLFEIHKYQFDEKKIDLRLLPDLSNKPKEINTDKRKLIQILSNLLSNSLKFTEQGFTEFGYDIRSKTFEFYVKDSGIGIENFQCEKVFECFRQVELEYTRKYGGNGLGLSICKGFVELLGGEIWLESEIGKGSTFYFTLPYNK
ncbi:MAG: PAS domain S-box protein [Bacteroidales bacterium]|nr:PAS domain S-box protein [Bacteroidales bacterium]